MGRIHFPFTNATAVAETLRVACLLAMWLNLHECSYNNNGIKIELMTMEFRKNWIYGDVIQIF